MEQVKNLVKNLTVSDGGGYKPPGRLGDPNMSFENDPRTNPILLKTLQALNMAGYQVGEEVHPDDTPKAEAITKASHEAYSGLYESLPIELPSDAGEAEVEEKEIVIDGLDGNKINLWVFRTKEGGSELKPAVLYIHGGGMTIIPTRAKPHVRWCKSLALLGTVAVLVDFRNSWQPDGTRVPFPGGLNDCAAAVKYIDAHKSELGISKIVIEGESGGANLSIATTLKAKREGWANAIAGVFGYVPYISGAYGWSDERKYKELPSLKENEGYLLPRNIIAMAKYYSPGEGELENPLAWPYWASEEDLKGLPPHFLSMDELDPLRDEGIAYGRKLLAAGVRVTSQVNLGIGHGTSMIFRQALADEHTKQLRHVVAFVKSV